MNYDTNVASIPSSSRVSSVDTARLLQLRALIERRRETLHIRKQSPVLAVAASEVRYYLALQDTLLVSWGLTRAIQRPGDVPYVRKSPDSRWGVRVEIVAGATGLDSVGKGEA